MRRRRARQPAPLRLRQRGVGGRNSEFDRRSSLQNVALRQASAPSTFTFTKALSTAIHPSQRAALITKNQSHRRLHHRRNLHRRNLHHRNLHHRLHYFPKTTVACASNSTNRGALAFPFVDRTAHCCDADFFCSSHLSPLRGGPRVASLPDPFNPTEPIRPVSATPSIWPRVGYWACSNFRPLRTQRSHRGRLTRCWHARHDSTVDRPGCRRSRPRPAVAVRRDLLARRARPDSNVVAPQVGLRS